MSGIEGKEFYVRVVSVRIERESVWRHRLSYWKTRDMGDRICERRSSFDEHKTIELDREERDISDNLLGPFFWKWNNPDVRVIFHHKDATPPNFASTFDEDEAFKIRNFNPKLPISHDGGKISLMLECKDVEPPLIASLQGPGQMSGPLKVLVRRWVHDRGCLYLRSSGMSNQEAIFLRDAC